MSDITDVLSGAACWAVVHGEALATLATMPDASIDAVVTDPPYASMSEAASYMVKGKRSRAPSETQFFEAWLREHLREWARIIKPTGAVWMTIDWRGALCLDDAAAKLGLRAPSVGVWDRGGLGMGFIMRHIYECFAVLPMDRFARQHTDEPDLWRCEWTPGKRESEGCEHSAQKPIPLFQRAINLVCPPGGVILDPFGGSMTTIAAALLEGRRAIGIEREAAYVEVGRTRCANVAAGNPPAPREIKQIAMFPKAP